MEVDQDLEDATLEVGSNCQVDISLGIHWLMGNRSVPVMGNKQEDHIEVDSA